MTHKKMPKTSSKPENQLKRLLAELANMHDQGASRFWKEWGNFRKESSQTLFALREQLRHVWEQEISRAEIVKILDNWMNFRHTGLHGIAYFPWKTALTPPRMLPNSDNLRGYLVFAVLNHLPALAVCRNPNCPAKYFIARRKDQKFCGGECKDYAQRQYALKYWNDKGHRLRKQRLVAKKKTKRGN